MSTLCARWLFIPRAPARCPALSILTLDSESGWVSLPAPTATAEPAPNRICLGAEVPVVRLDVLVESPGPAGTQNARLSCVGIWPQAVCPLCQSVPSQRAPEPGSQGAAQCRLGLPSVCRPAAGKHERTVIVSSASYPSPFRLKPRRKNKIQRGEVTCPRSHGSFGSRIQVPSIDVTALGLSISIFTIPNFLYEML